LEGSGTATIRNAVRVTAGGKRLRIRLCNMMGGEPLVVGRVTIALQVRPGSPEAVRGTMAELTFSGDRSVVVPPESHITSDPVDFDLANEASLLVSLFVSAQPQIVTMHKFAPNLSYCANGQDVSTSHRGADFTESSRSWRYLAAVEVSGGDATGTVAVLGDSLSTTYPQPPDVHAAWPDHFARRLLYGSGRPALALASVAVGGNRLLRDGFNHPDHEPNELFPVRAAKRHEWDLLPLAGLRTVIMPLGTTDVFQKPNPAAQEILAGLQDLAQQLCAHGLKVIGATLPPRWPSTGYTAEMDAVREELNNLIRSGALHADFVDFDAILRSDKDPRRLRPAYDSGDHLHPNIDGHLAVASAIDLDVL
jgi:lysophospholipase L1-like esterase